MMDRMDMVDTMDQGQYLTSIVSTISIASTVSRSK